MKKNHKLMKTVAMSMTVLTMLSAAGGMATTVFATPETPYVSTNALSDDSSQRTITLWKYEINSAAELGERGDGEKIDPSQTPDTTGKKVMKDVEFEIVRVIPKKDASGNYYVLDDPTKQVAGTHYELDSTFTPVKQKTDANGKTTFDVGKGKAADGVYLIREVPNASGEYTYTDENGETKTIATPMAPFFAYLPQTKRDDTGKLIYDVHVYPKNIVTETSLDKTVDGQKGHSIKAGQDFQWEATVKVPTGLYFVANDDMTIINRFDKDGNPLPDLDVAKGTEVFADHFYIHDELNENLHLDDVAVEIFDGTNWVPLTMNTDYTVEKNGAAVTTSPVTNPNGAKTDVKISLTQDGMKKVETQVMNPANAEKQLRVVYKTHVDQDFNGVIENKFDMGYLIPGQKPITDESEHNPEYFNGGFEIDKTEEDKAKKLEGAEFHIAASEQDAKDEIFIASDGKSYAKTATLPAGVTFLTDTTDATGHAQFDGLKLEWFTDTNNNGKQDKDEPTWDHADIEKDYWLVETKSPEGFELLKDPVKVTVNLGKSGATIVHVENKTQTKLPFTGGEGTMLLVSIAIGAITLGTVAISIDKKRRQA